MARTQEQRKAETRARLITAAADLFARRGFHAVSTEIVADAAGRTTGALYSHFGNKDGLLLALLEDWKDVTAVEIVAHVPDQADLDGIISAAWDRISSIDDPAGSQWLLLEMELWLHGARDEAMGSELCERYASIRADFALGLEEFSSAGGHSLPASPDQLAAMALSVLLGAALQHRFDPSSMPPEWVIAAVRAIVGLPFTSPSRSTP